MLITQHLTIKWSPSQRPRYENKGYIFTNYGDEFQCKVEDIPHSSDRFIECECDYCHKTFSKQIKKYYKHREILHKDCCESCKGKKCAEVKLLKYGTNSPYDIGKGVDILENRKIDDERRIWKQVVSIFKERNYTLLSEKYIDSTSPIYYICNKHKDDGVQYIDWGHLRDGRGCRSCGIERSADIQRFSYEHVKNIVEEEFKEDNCKLISDTYTGYNDYNLKVRCECGDIFTISLSLFIKNKRKCNNCNSSIGEQLIDKYLKDNDFIFKREYEISPYEWDNPLYYDFYIPSLKIAIEYDGEQHFKPIDFNGEGLEIATEKFEIQLIRDKIKNDYSERNNIKLIRIPYWERDNISTILNKELQLESQQDFLLLCSNE